MWKQGLCGCFSNCSLSMIACCTAPLAIGKNAEAVGEAHPVLWALSVLGAPCVAGALLRGLIRKKKVCVYLALLSYWNNSLLHTLFRLGLLYVVIYANVDLALNASFIHGLSSPPKLVVNSKL